MNRLRILDVQITDGATQIFKGLLEDFLEGFVHDETYFLKELSKAAMKNGCKFGTVLWADTQKEITVNFI